MVRALHWPSQPRWSGDGKARRTVATVNGMKWSVLVFGLAMCLAMPLAADEPLTIKVSPAVSFAPCNLLVRTYVAHNARNRAIEVIAQSNDFYRSSEVQLDGDQAPRTSTFEFRSLPPGAYDVKAILKGSDEEAWAIAHQQVNVIDAGTDDGR